MAEMRDFVDDFGAELLLFGGTLLGRRFVCCVFCFCMCCRLVSRMLYHLAHHRSRLCDRRARRHSNARQWNYAALRDVAGARLARRFTRIDASHEARRARDAHRHFLRLCAKFERRLRRDI